MVFLVLPVAAIVLGAWALKPLRLDRGAAGMLARFCAGLVACGFLILALGGIALVLAKWAIVAIAAGGLTCEVFLRKKRKTETMERPDVISRTEHGVLFWMGLGAAAAGILLAFLPVLAPATELAAVSGPLASAKDYQSLGRLAPYDGAGTPAYASLAHCLYAWAYTTGNEAGVRILSWLVTLFAACALYVLANRLSGACAGAVAAGAFAVTPVFLNRAAALSGDMLSTGLFLASLTALVIWRTERRLAWLVLAGIFLGNAWDGSWAVLVLSCAALPFVACLAKYDRLSHTIVFAVVMTAALAPWLLARAFAGAPFVLPVTGVQAAPETGLAAFLKYPWNVVMRPHWYGGWTTAPGGLLLILGLPGVVIGGKKVRWLCGFAVVCGIALYFADHSHESILPLAAVFIAAAAVGACRLEVLRPLVAVALAAVFLQGLYINGWTAVTTVREASRRDYAAHRVPRHEAIEWVNENLPRGQRILTPEPFHYFIEMPTYRHLESVAQLEGADEATVRTWLHTHNIGYLVFPETHVRTHREAFPRGAVAVLDQWRSKKLGVFVLIQVLKVPAGDGEGAEQVEIYEFRNGTQSATRAVS